MRDGRDERDQEDRVVEAVPPTVRDETLARGDPARPKPPAPLPPPRLPDRGARIAVAAFLMLLVLALSLVAFYALVWRYDPVARRHVPGNANVALRVELTEVALFGPVRKHLWPLFEEKSAAVPSKTRAEQLRERTGLDLRDVRELVVASVDATSWVVLVGGRIPRGRVVEGIEELLRDEGWSGWRMQGDILVAPNGAAIAQADDGVLVIGTDAAIVTAALPASDDAASLGLPVAGAIAFATTQDAWLVGARVLPSSHASALAKVEHATGRLVLGESPRLTARLRVAGDAASIATDLEALLGALRLASLLGPDIAGEKQALRSATVSVEEGAVVVSADWPLDGLDRACERLARAVRDTRAEAAVSGAASAAPPAVRSAPSPVGSAPNPGAKPAGSSSSSKP